MPDYHGFDVFDVVARRFNGRGEFLLIAVAGAREDVGKRCGPGLGQISIGRNIPANFGNWVDCVGISRSG